MHAADLDGDGDADVLSASWDDDKIAWYENLSHHGDDHGEVPDATATFATALPAFLHGVVESGGDRDMFRFVTGSGTLRVYSNGPTDTFGTLLDAYGRQLATNDDTGSGLNFEIEATVSAGVNYVEVRHFSPTGTGAYTLSIEFVASASASANDHGDDIQTAAVAPALPWSTAGTLEVGGDRDVFRLDVGEGGVLRLRTTGDTNTYGTLMNADGTVLVQDDDLGAGSNFGIEEGVSAGVYYIEVRGHSPDTTGSYELSVEWTAEAGFSSAATMPGGVGNPTSAHAADLDGDADLDVLSASGDGKVAWYRNLGGGSFSAQRVWTTADGVASVYAADLDADGDADVLSGSVGGHRLGWHENRGGGAFSGQGPVAGVPASARSVRVADLDGDGDADVLGTHGRVYWYENQGSGAFSALRSVATDTDTAWAAHPVDLDGDGDADVVFSSTGDGTVAWYENQGGGRFSAKRVITTDAVDAHSVHAADLDGDGDADLLSASYGDDKIAWYENLGDGTFSAQRLIAAVADGAESVYAADVDGDGDADVLSASSRDDTIAWYANRGGGRFSARQVIAADADGAKFVFAADLDGDGDADVLASSGDDKISWYENLSDHGDDRSDERAEATMATALPAFLHGVLESAGDRDVFRVSTGAGTLRASAHGPTDTQGRLTNAAGDVLDQDDDSGSSLNFGVEARVAAGDYYIEVTGFDGASTGQYVLMIEFVAD